MLPVFGQGVHLHAAELDRVGIPRQLLPHGAQVVVVGRVHRLEELRRRLDLVVAQVRHEAGAHAGAVLVDDVAADGEVVHLAGGDREAGERRSEQEEAHAVLLVPPTDLREDRKRRIINHHAALRVADLRVVSAGIEGPDDRRALEVVILHRPGSDGLVDVRGGVAVVGRQLGLELVDELVVLFRAFGLLVPEVLVLAELDPAGIEADQLDVKAGGLQRLGLGPEKVLVVAGLAEQVVRVHEGAPLLVGEILDQHGRDLGPAFGLRGQEAPVAVDHPVELVDADRHDHAELPEGSPQALDLLGRVLLRVVFIGMQLGDLPELHLGDCSHVFLLDRLGRIYVRSPRGSQAFDPARPVCCQCVRGSPSRFTSAARAHHARKPWSPGPSPGEISSPEFCPACA